MYGGRPPGYGPPPAVGTSGSATGGSLADDGTNSRPPPRRSGPGASSGARQASAGGDDSIFSSAEGLTKLARSRAASSYAGSAHGGSQSSRQGAGAPRPDPSHKVTYYGEASRRAGSVGSQGSGDNRDHRDHPRSPSRPARESRDARHAHQQQPHRQYPPHRRSSFRPTGAAPQAWVRVEDVIKSTKAAETALKRRAEPTRPATLYSEASAQTEVADLRDDNPNAQLKFQAALQTELRETQEALAEARMRAKQTQRERDRLAEDLEAATRANVVASATRSSEALEGGDPGEGEPGTISAEEMDETVNSLLEMITAERDKATALEHHLDRAMDELETERDAHHAMKSALAAHKDAVAEEFTAQEQKLREATEIIGELRHALLQVMHVRDGSVAGGSVRGPGSVAGGSVRGPGSDGGRSAGSRRSFGSRGEAAAANGFATGHPPATAAIRPAPPLHVRPLSAAALAQAREDSARRSEEAVRRWERRLEEGVDGVIRRAMDRASRESFGAAFSADDALVRDVVAAARGVMGEVVEAHMGAIVDEMRDRFEEVAGTRGGGDGTRATSWRPEGKTGRERLVMWMAEENMKRAELRERLAAAADDLARSEAGRMEATQRWLELQSEHGGSVRGDAASDFGDGLSDAGGARTPARTPAIGGQWPGNGSARENGRVAEASERKTRSGEGVDGESAVRAAGDGRSSPTKETRVSGTAGAGVRTPGTEFSVVVRSATAMVRRVVAAPMFELLWPLFLALCLLRAQIGEDLFTRRSLSRGGWWFAGTAPETSGMGHFHDATHIGEL